MKIIKKYMIGIAILCNISFFCAIQSVTILDVRKMIKKAQKRNHEIAPQDAKLMRMLIKEKIQAKQTEELHAVQEILTRANDEFEYRGCLSDKKLAMLQTATLSADKVSLYIGFHAILAAAFSSIGTSLLVWKLVLAQLYPKYIPDIAKEFFISLPDKDGTAFHRLILAIVGSTAVAAINFSFHFLLGKITKKLTNLRKKRMRMVQNKKTTQSLLNYMFYKQGALGWDLI